MKKTHKQLRNRGVGKGALLEDIQKFINATTMGEKINTKELDFLFDLFISSVRMRIINQERVAISGFGTFFLSKRCGRTLNQGGKRLIEVPDYRVVRFKSSGSMKSAVNGKAVVPLLVIPSHLRIIAAQKSKTKKRRTCSTKKQD